MERVKKLIGWGDSHFYRVMIALALPIMLQQGLSSLLFLIDNVMVGRLGETEIAAVGVANQLTFLMQIFGFGINNGASIFAAQFWGRRDVQAIRRVEGLALTISLAVGFVFTAVGITAGNWVADIFSDDPEVILLAAKYLKIASLGYVFQLIAQAVGVILRASGDPVLPMKATLAGVLTNAVFNYILIFGKLGLPALGVEGAAIATVIASVVNAAALLLVSYKKKNPVAASARELFSFDRKLAKEFFQVSLPVFANEALWSLGITLYTVLYGILGTQTQAAMQIYNTVDRIGFVMMAALGSACGVMVGNCIGEGDVERGKLYGKRMLVITPAAVLCVGLLLHLALPLFMTLFSVSEQVRQMALGVMRVYCSVLWIYSLNYTIIIGILRAGGDTVYASIADLAGLWAVSLPCAYLTGLVLHWPLWAMFLATVAGDMVKGVIGIRRVRSGKWINVLKS